MKNIKKRAISVICSAALFTSAISLPLQAGAAEIYEAPDSDIVTAAETPLENPFTDDNPTVDLNSIITAAEKTDYYLAIPNSNIKFTVLDESDDTESSFFLYSQNYVNSTVTVDTASAENKTMNFDPNIEHPSGTTTTHIKYKLNNEYISGTWGNGRKLPSVYKDYIDMEHEWLTEGSYAAGLDGNDYTFKAGVTLLSYNELLQYKDRLSKNCGNTILLRTSKNSSGSAAVARLNNSGQVDTAVSGNVHTCFWIGEDFFKNEKIDIANTGSSVKKMIYNRYSAAEIKEAGYTISEITEFGYTLDDMAEAGFTAEELKDAYTLAELKEAGYTASQLKDAYALTELKGAGFTAAEIKEAGYTAAEAKAAGYTVAQLKEAGYTEEELDGLTDELAIKGILKPGYILTASHNELGTYQWYSRASADDEWTPIDGANSESYTLVNADGGSYIRFTVTADDDSILEDTQTDTVVDAPLINDITGPTAVENFPQITPPENVFSVAGDTTAQNFIMLDSSEDKASSFFIYADADVKEYPIYGNQNMDPNGDTDGGKLKCKLNKDYLYEGWGDKPLPSQFIPYIDTNHIWLTEGGAPDGARPNDYTFKAGVTLLSLTEFRQYASKIGYGTQVSTALRTGATSEKTYLLRLTNTGEIKFAVISLNTRVRPCFWIGEDFFKNVKLNLDKTGDNVKAALKERYTASDIKGAGYTAVELKSIGYELNAIAEAGYTAAELKGAGYTAAELKEAGYDTAAELKEAGCTAAELKELGFTLTELIAAGYTVSALREAGYTEDELSEILVDPEITGTLKPGYTLTALHNEAGTYKWYRGTSADGKWTEIEGAADNSYTLTNADGGHYIKFTVTDTDGDVIEEIVTVAAVDEALVNPMPETQDLSSLLYDGGTPADYFFELASDTRNQKFIVLTSSEDKKSSFFIFSHNPVANAPVQSSSDADRVENFDPNLDLEKNAGSHIKYILNNEYLNGEWGSSFPLPSSLKGYIDTEHVWLTEGSIGPNVSEDNYTFKAAVTLLSYNELLEFGSRIGKTTVDARALRTGSNSASSSGTAALKNNGTVVSRASASNSNIHPCFWLGEDFFRNIKLDLAATGSEVKKLIRERYKKSELAHLYSEEELKAIGYTDCRIYDLKCKNADGEEISDITLAGNTLNVSTVVANYSNEGKAGVMIIAVYDKGGDMVKAALSTNAQFTVGSEVPLSAEIDLTGINIEKGYKVAVFFWNNVKDMVPIVESSVLQ